MKGDRESGRRSEREKGREGRVIEKKRGRRGRGRGRDKKGL